MSVRSVSNEQKRLRGIRWSKLDREAAARGPKYSAPKPAKRNGHRTQPTFDHPCPCGGICEPLKGSAMHPSDPNVADLNYYRCVRCNRRCGTHPGSWEPLGTPANAVERMLRQKVHRAMDPLWNSYTGTAASRARSNLYEWLSRQLGISRAECHIGLMDEEILRRALAAILARVDH